ncbi:hypothetical protein OQA88_8063 [Cercophora sp. LCS_1]
MASLLPIIQEILPMILPASISVTKSSDVLPRSDLPAEPNGSTSGVRVLSCDAVVGKTDKMCTTVLIVKPKSSTTIHHNGEQEAIIYAVSGTGILLSAPKDDEDEDNEEPERHVVEKGDFAFIPAWTEHQVVNESEEGLHWVITRTGPQPVEVNLVGWGGDEAKEPPEPPQQR